MSIKVVSLFSGGGGLDLGFKKAGYDIIWAVDNNPNAVETYRVNLGNHIICEDITKIVPSSIPHADVVIGGVNHFHLQENVMLKTLVVN